MIDYREFDNVKQNYEIWKDVDGTIYTVNLPTERELIKVGKIQFMTQELQKQYDKLIKQKESAELYDKIDELYNKLMKTVQEAFLLVLNLNTQGKVFTYEDIEKVPFKAINAEFNNYIEFINSQLKN